MDSDLFGMRVVSHHLAERVERVPRITLNPTPKRRRRWLLRYETVRTPCAFKIGNTLYVHPTAYAAMVLTPPGGRNG